MSPFTDILHSEQTHTEFSSAATAVTYTIYSLSHSNLVTFRVTTVDISPTLFLAGPF